MLSQCQGKIKLTKKEIAQGITDDSCHNTGAWHCEDCSKMFCRHHINRDRHECDDSVKGCHSCLQ